MRLRHLLLGTACVLASAGTAAAGIPAPTGWYFSLAGGANWLEDSDFTVVAPLPVVTGSAEHEVGYIVSGAIGYDFGRWRAEFEVAYRDNDLDCVSFAGGGTCFTVPVDVGVWELSQMVNVFYDFDFVGNWSASLGLGAGGNLVVFDLAGLIAPEPDDYVFAGQAIAQVAYQFSSRWQLFADYRFMYNDDPTIELALIPHVSVDTEKQEHAVQLGIRFDLQGVAAPPPPPPPPPAPAPAPRQPKQFIVFFGFNKSNLTPEADRVVADAAAAAKEYGSASIIVVGHTDTVGSNSYNNALSMRRSQTVKDGLVGRGIPAEAISTGGRGESELMVQTGDGVKEPQNRRATIDLN